MYKSVIYLLLITFILLGCSKVKNDLTHHKENELQEEPGKKQDVSSTNGVNTKLSVDELIIKTSDGKDISASYYFTEGQKDSKEPVVILVHQFKQSKEQWGSDFIQSLQTAGYKVLTFDIRGHGKSAKQDGELSALLSDPEQTPKDIEAVVKRAKEQMGIDTSRIAVIGTSIGGNLALYAKFKKLVKTSIAVSNGKETFESFTGYNEAMMGRPYFEKFSNVFLICGNKDGDCEQGQKWIYDNFLESPKEMKVYDSSKHGKDLIAEKPEIKTMILDWLKKYL